MSFLSTLFAKVAAVVTGMLVTMHFITPTVLAPLPVTPHASATPISITKPIDATPTTHSAPAIQKQSIIPVAKPVAKKAPPSTVPKPVSAIPAVDAPSHDRDSASRNTHGLGGLPGQGLGWTYAGIGPDWTPIGNPPACPSPLTPPVDFSTVSGLLYPGQTRGGNYKAHGGFRFDATGNSVSVTIPLDAYLMSGSRYIEMGEVQYLLFFLTPCGIMYRFDHLHDLTPALMAKLNSLLPEPKVDDSRTTSIDPPISFHTGDAVATVVGFVGTRNASLDFGVYDMRTRNSASQNAAWSARHYDFYAQHAVCWLDWFTPAQSALLHGLPGADYQNGKTSDFCL